MRYKLPFLRRACLAFLVLLFFAVPAGFRVADAAKKAEKVGDETCLTCHEDVGKSFAHTIHAQKITTKGYTCEACHGPGSVHAESMDPADIYNPATDYNPVAPNPCLTCHNGPQFTSATASAHHELADGCSDCHQVHSTEPKLLKKQGSELCVECHRDIGAKFNLTSHHPVKEGLMTCTSCHAVHGGDNTFTHTSDSRELCISCHTDKAGPFVFEHEPVNEDCGICHDPHGTVANNLLKQTEPFLCMSCHPVHFHTGIAGYIGDFKNPLHPERGGKSTLDGFKSSMLTKCTQCHTQVHGSDLPSESISSRGRSLTR